MSAEKTLAEKVADVEGYLDKRRLYYGPEPNKNGDASWSIGLEGHPFPPIQQYTLTVEAPIVIGDFINGTEQLLKQSLSSDRIPGANLPIDRLNRYITAGVPEPTLVYWDKAIKKQQKVKSARPDMVSTGGKLLPGQEVTLGGDLKIIEYNIDGRADKGNTQGVYDYSKKFLDLEPMGENLAYLFIQQIRDAYPDKDEITVATVLPNKKTYRNEYDAQNEYFADEADALGKKFGVNWLAVRLSEIEIQDSKVVVKRNGKTSIIDVIDSEFEVPGYTEDHDFNDEELLLNAVFEGKVDLLGSLLPHSNKVLLSTLYDSDYATAFDPFVLPHAQALHAPTGILDPVRNGVFMGDTFYTFDDIATLKTGDRRLVMKGGGDTERNTGSRSVRFSPNLIKSDSRDYEQAVSTWQQAIETALKDPQKDGYWTVQLYFPSDKFSVSTMQNSRKKPQTYNVSDRIAPYYFRKKNRFKLGGILVTEATDREMRVRQWENIHMRRDNTYNTGVRSNDGLEWQQF